MKVLVSIVATSIVLCSISFAQEANQYLPRWSPDGEKYSIVEIKRVRGTISSSIKIYENYNEIADLGKMSTYMLEGQGLPRDLATGLYFFDWASNSNGYVFTSMGQSNYNLFVSPDLGGENTYQLTRGSQADITPSWSPDGKHIAFMRGNKLHLIHSEDNFQTPPTGDPEEISLNAGQGVVLEKAMFSEWSPDSKRITFSGLLNGQFDIFLYDVLTQKIESVTRSVGISEYHPVFSPDGEWLAFYSKRREKGEQFNISIIRSISNGSTIDIATSVLQSVLLGPSWMPGSRSVAYVKHDEANGYPVEIAEFEVSNKAVRVHNPIRLETDTRINAEVQVSVSGTVAFRCYQRVGGLPLQVIDFY